MCLRVGEEDLHCKVFGPVSSIFFPRLLLVRVVQLTSLKDHLHSILSLLTLIHSLSDKVGVQPEEEGAVVIGLKQSEQSSRSQAVCYTEYNKQPAPGVTGGRPFVTLGVTNGWKYWIEDSTELKLANLDISKNLPAAL